MSTWDRVQLRDRRGRPVRTSAVARLYGNGALDLPAALVDAIGAPDRVHLFVRRDAPGELWVCPASDPDSTDSFKLTTDARYYPWHRLTAAGLPDALQVDADADTLRGPWHVEDDRVVIRFGEVGP